MERFEELEKEDELRRDALDGSCSNSDDSRLRNHSSKSSSSSSSHSSKSSSSSQKSKSHSSKSEKTNKDNSEKSSKEEDIQDDKDIHWDNLFITPETKKNKCQIAKLDNCVLSYKNIICEIQQKDLLYHPQSNTTFTVLKSIKNHSNPSIIIQNKEKKEGKEEITVTLDTINEYTVYRDIKILYINYLNQTKQLLYPVDINQSLKQFSKSFISTYKFEEETFSIIYKEVKVNLDDFNLFSFDFNNDYLIVLEHGNYSQITIGKLLNISVSSPNITTYVTFIKKNIQIKSIQFVLEKVLMSSYIEIYHLDIQFNESFLNENKMNKVNKVKKLMKDNWTEKANLVYSFPLIQIINDLKPKYSFSQNVILNEGTVYVMIIHLYLIGNKHLKIMKHDLWIENEFEIVSQNNQFSFNQIKLNRISDLLLSA